MHICTRVKCQPPRTQGQEMWGKCHLSPTLISDRFAVTIAKFLICRSEKHFTARDNRATNQSASCQNKVDATQKEQGKGSYLKADSGGWGKAFFSPQCKGNVTSKLQSSRMLLQCEGKRLMWLLHIHFIQVDSLDSLK